jgi:competence protein ComEC
MPKRKIIYSLLLILFVISLILWGAIFYSQNQKLKIVFFDIGQGDAILISQGQNQILIDGGPDAQKMLEKLGEYMPFWDRKVEIVVATHPDQDHIDGLIGVMKNYKIGEVVDNSATSDSQVFKNYLNLMEENKIPRLKGEKGMKIKFSGAELEILYPGKDLENNPKDTNADSLVVKLAYGPNSFLFTGDFPSEKDEKLFEGNSDLSARVLKVAHHGSKYSTSAQFLEKVHPVEAVISVGKDNRYGHPAPEILDRLKNNNIKVLRTDEMGDIVYNCDDSKKMCLLEVR